MYKLIIFDIDGTIADTDIVLIKSFSELFKKYRPEYKYSKKKIITFSGPSIEETMSKEFPNQSVDFMEKEYRKVSVEYYKKYIRAFRGCKKYILKLKNEGYKIAIATSKHKKSTLYCLELLHMENMFDVMVCGDEVTNGKPDPEILNILIKNLAVPQQNVLFVGDTMYDYYCAKNANVDIALMNFRPRIYEDNIKPNFKGKSFRKLYKFIKAYE